MNRRHRWYIAIVAALLAIPLALLFTPLPLPVVAILSILAFPSGLIWITVGQKWVWAAGPARPTDSVDQARRVGLRIMVVLFSLRVVVEFVSLPFSGRQLSGEFVARIIITGAAVAFIMGKMAEYRWSRRAANAPTPWLFRVWPL